MDMSKSYLPKAFHAFYRYVVGGVGEKREGKWEEEGFW